MSKTRTEDSAPSPVSFWQAFRFWFKLGFISFGGPAGQIAIMHEELVERRGRYWELLRRQLLEESIEKRALEEDMRRAA